MPWPSLCLHQPGLSKVNHLGSGFGEPPTSNSRCFGPLILVPFWDLLAKPPPEIEPEVSVPFLAPRIRVRRAADLGFEVTSLPPKVLSPLRFHTRCLVRYIESGFGDPPTLDLRWQNCHFELQVHFGGLAVLFGYRMLGVNWLLKGFNWVFR